MKILTPAELEKAFFIEQRRLRASANDTPELRTLRGQHLSKLSQLDYSVRVLEMYAADNPDGAIKSKEKNHLEINKFHNQRTNIKTATSLEIDKLGFNKVVPIICEICLSLMRNKINFYVFYSEGGRSPYIIIYDFAELWELTEIQRVKAQIFFWKKHVPQGCFQYVDTGIFDKEHYHVLEYAPHWKTGKPFDLLFEYDPNPPLTYEQILAPKKFYSKLRAEGKTHEEARRITDAKFTD